MSRLPTQAVVESLATQLRVDHESRTFDAIDMIASRPVILYVPFPMMLIYMAHTCDAGTVDIQLELNGSPVAFDGSGQSSTNRTTMTFSAVILEEGDELSVAYSNVSGATQSDLSIAYQRIPPDDGTS